MSSLMEKSPINVQATLISNLIGISIIILFSLCNFYVTKELIKKNKFVLVLGLLTILSCTLESVCAFIDGALWVDKGLLMAVNTILYLIGVATAIAWVFNLTKYMKVKLGLFQTIFLGTFSLTATGLIIANIFTPLLFKINEYNVYERVDVLYLVYTICYFAIIVDCIIVYLIKKYQSGGVKFFPIWTFIFPIVIGIVIQYFVYGVSTIAPFMAIAIVLMSVSFQHNLIFRDQLTDLYNRYYLGLIEKKLSPKKKGGYSVLMLDLNDFKMINDIYGHDIGDKALISFSNILTKTIDKNGEVIRYAGDEFIIILNYSDHEIALNYADKIKNAVKHFNENSGYEWKLSTAIGSCSYDFNKGINVCISEADKKMYLNKEEYYRQFKND